MKKNWKIGREKPEPSYSKKGKEKLAFIPTLIFAQSLRRGGGEEGKRGRRVGIKKKHRHFFCQERSEITTTLID